MEEGTGEGLLGRDCDMWKGKFRWEGISKWEGDMWEGNDEKGGGGWEICGRAEPNVSIRQM